MRAPTIQHLETRKGPRIVVNNQPLNAHEQRAFEWHGWLPAPNHKKCPRVLAGKQCAMGSWNPCICSRYALTMLDHSRRWTTHDGEHLLTSEPYGLHGDSAEFMSEVADLGLTVTNLGADRSPWYPGCTTLLVIRREITP